MLKGDDFSNKMNTVGNPKSLRPQLPQVCQDHIATGVLLVLGTNHTCKQPNYTRITTESTRENFSRLGLSDCMERAVKLPRPGRIPQPPNDTNNTETTQDFFWRLL
jgi:hypothetical protein